MRAHSIFGGSDSELSDVEEDVQQQQGQAIDAGDVSGYDEEDEAAALEAEAERLAGPEGDEDEEDDRGGDADYTDLAKKDVNGLPSFKKDPNRKRNAVDGEERPKSATLRRYVDSCIRLMLPGHDIGKEPRRGSNERKPKM